jgi:hypothetical protein
MHAVPDGELMSPVAIKARIMQGLLLALGMGNLKAPPGCAGRNEARFALTYPAHFTQDRLAAFKDAVELGGLHRGRVVAYVDEASAAAIALLHTDNHFGGFADGEVRHILLLDVGGGTYDVSLLCIKRLFMRFLIDVVDVGGISAGCGGTDIQATLRDLLASSSCSQLDAACEPIMAKMAGEALRIAAAERARNPLLHIYYLGICGGASRSDQVKRMAERVAGAVSALQATPCLLIQPTLSGNADMMAATGAALVARSACGLPSGSSIVFQLGSSTPRPFSIDIRRYTLNVPLGKGAAFARAANGGDDAASASDEAWGLVSRRVFVKPDAYTVEGVPDSFYALNRLDARDAYNACDHVSVTLEALIPRRHRVGAWYPPPGAAVNMVCNVTTAVLGELLARIQVFEGFSTSASDARLVGYTAIYATHDLISAFGSGDRITPGSVWWITRSRVGADGSLSIVFRILTKDCMETQMHASKTTTTAAETELEFFSDIKARVGLIQKTSGAQAKAIRDCLANASPAARRPLLEAKLTALRDAPLSVFAYFEHFKDVPIDDVDEDAVDGVMERCGVTLTDERGSLCTHGKRTASAMIRKSSL